MSITRSINGTVIAVMVVWNGKDFLCQAIDSVLQTLRSEDDFLIVDNGSTDGSFELIRQEYPDVAVLQTHNNLGGAGGFNAGVSFALQSERCKYVWLLDNDILVDACALQPLINVLESNFHAAAVGSQICIFDSPDTIQEIGANYSPWLGTLQTLHTGEQRLPVGTAPYRVDYLAACSLLIKSEVIRNEGLFKDFFVFYDDVEWGLRINQMGLELWAVPSSVIWHHFNILKPTIPWREYYKKRNHAVCLAMHPPKKGKVFALWIYLVALNFRIFVFKHHNQTILYDVYRQALMDFLNCKLGQHDMPDYFIDSSSINHNSKKYYIDIKKIGDALTAIRQVYTQYPDSNFYLARNQHAILHELAPRLIKDMPEAGTATAIVDDDFCFNTLRKCSKLYRYHLGKFQHLDDPYYFL